MSELHLDSLEIKNFRCFEHLVIEKLGRVNLIVGKNSVGKTCLLEAIRLYATNANFPDLMWMLAERGEVSPGVDPDLSLKPDHIVSLFYNMTCDVGQSAIQIGDGKGIEKKVLIKLEYYLEDSNNPAILKIIEPEDVVDAENLQVGLSIFIGNTSKIYRFPLSTTRKSENRISSDFIKKCVFVPCNGLNKFFMPVYWDGVVLDGYEDSVLAALRLLDSDIERFHLVASPEVPRERYAVVKTKKFDKPIRLRNLGDGIMRISGIAIAAVQAKNGYLLVDEFENGLHHSVQLDAWRFIFRVAKELNIQVFATTHSWDCVEAFQAAAAENEDEDAMLIRLQRKKDGTTIKAVSYDKREMDIVTRQGIEVR